LATGRGIEYIERMFPPRWTIVALALALASPTRAQTTDPPKIMAHRGGAALADENTLAAFRLAAECGVDLVECDPRLTADGEFVLMHDPTVDRTTNGSGRVSDLTLAEVRALRTTHGERVPTLVETLRWAREAEVEVFLDQKNRRIEVVEAMLDVVDAEGMADRVVFGVWWTAVLAWLHENRPEIATMIPWPLPVPTFARARALGADWVGMMVRQATPERIRQAAANGLAVVTMPLNDPAGIRRAIRDGLPVIQTDDPALVRRILGENR
jgi:glycerophosphoryl diester phosphodiesterase